MRVFVYEFVTGGGMLEEGLPDSLLREGDAMLRAIASDLCVIEGTEVVTTRDSRAPNWRDSPRGLHIVEVNSPIDESEAFDRLAAEADAAIVIAPEIGGALTARLLRLERIGARLLGVGYELAALASDKFACGNFLAARGVAVPRGVLAADAGERGPVFGFPAVIKPRDGAGCLGVRRIKCIAEWREMRPWRDSNLVVEQFQPGVAASVSVIAAPHALHVLPPCRQTLSDDGALRYLGGALPLPTALAERAAALARKTLLALPCAIGYLGVDLVLGSDPADAEDFVIEVNPRLTTSYVGLRAAARGNLAEWMIGALSGQTPPFAFSDDAWEFTSDGVVRGTTADSVAKALGVSI